MGAKDWEQKNEWYWQGPDGWTICRVITPGHVERFAIWRPNGPEWEDLVPSLAGAIKRHAELIS